VLTHEVERAVALRPDVDDAGGVLALELREHPSLAPEALDLLVVSGARQEQLDDDALIELDVEGVDHERRHARHDRAHAVFPPNHVPRVDVVRTHLERPTNYRTRSARGPPKPSSNPPWLHTKRW
jgi:hypothetical protein